MITASQTNHQPVNLVAFKTLSEVLDSASDAETGMNFYAGRGELSEVLLYRDLAEQARLVGRKLLAKGLKVGDRVGLVAETEADFVRAFMGCLYAHLVPCPLPLPAAFSSAEAYVGILEPILKVADANALIVPRDYQTLLDEYMTARPLHFTGCLNELGEELAELPDLAVNEQSIAYLQFSSGTTSAPKGVAVSHRAMMANLRGMIDDALELGAQDRGVSWLPFYHDMGLVGCMLLPIAAHMSLDYLPTRDFIRRPALWVTMMSRAKATLTYAPTFGYELAARRTPKLDDLDLSHWRIAGLGGDMIKPQSLRAFAQTYEPFGFSAQRFLPSYGMAEMTLGATFGRLNDGIKTARLDLSGLEKGRADRVGDGEGDFREFVCCGLALPGHSVVIKDQNGAKVKEREIGTVHLKGPSMMSGYFNNDDETANLLDKEGWLNTGDLGYFDQGQLTLTGRAKDLIIINGRNIWPQDIEWSIERAVDSVKEGKVAAFQGAYDEESGEERICVVVECRFSDPARRDALKTEVTSLIKTLFSVNPIVALSPSGLIPKTSSGKLSRSKTRVLYFEGAFE